LTNGRRFELTAFFFWPMFPKVRETFVIRWATQSHSVRRRRLHARLPHSAFTVVEILIVVFVLAILATVVIPQFSRASQQTKQDSLRDVLQYLRTQVTVFKAQHQDVPPGYFQGDPTTAPEASVFVDQMTHESDVNCNLRGSLLQYGPYLAKLPANPLNGMNTIEMVSNNDPMPAPDGKTGWIYKAQTQEIIANVTGRDASGSAYSSY
jgi:general secretion pathway protein G